MFPLARAWRRIEFFAIKSTRALGVAVVVRNAGAYRIVASYRCVRGAWLSSHTNKIGDIQVRTYVPVCLPRCRNLLTLHLTQVCLVLQYTQKITLQSLIIEGTSPATLHITNSEFLIFFGEGLDLSRKFYDLLYYYTIF